MRYQLFHEERLYHIEISPLICRANQWTRFLRDRDVMKELKVTSATKQ